MFFEIKKGRHWVNAFATELPSNNKAAIIGAPPGPMVANWSIIG